MWRNAKFWISSIVFQTAFGLAVFALTRHFYVTGADGVTGNAVTVSEETQEWADQSAESSSAMLDALISLPSTTQDPAEISRLANTYFAERQYEKAAQQYERLLTLGPSNADVHNNLGITLHYLGRSDEALRILDDGVALEPTNQRIWLTLGFVNKELGNIDAARTALTTAMQMGAENEVGKSAAGMLENLP
jgi:Flp pilus assembly protein TadD